MGPPRAPGCDERQCVKRSQKRKGDKTRIGPQVQKRGKRGVRSRASYGINQLRCCAKFHVGKAGLPCDGCKMLVPDRREMLVPFWWVGAEWRPFGMISWAGLGAGWRRASPVFLRYIVGAVGALFTSLTVEFRYRRLRP